MKRFLILILLGSFFLNCSESFAQTSIGGGLYLIEKTAIEAKADFVISDKFSISPSFNYFFIDYGTLIGVSAHAHYNLGDVEALNYYPLAGFHYFNYNYSGIVNVSASMIGFDLGGGLTYPLSENLKLLIYNKIA